MYYQTQLDGAKVDFKEFIKGLKNGESFKGIINTQKKVEVNEGPKDFKVNDSYIVIDDGEIKLIVYVNKNILTGEAAFKKIEDPDEIRYSRLNDNKLNEILKKAKEADVLI